MNTDDLARKEAELLMRMPEYGHFEERSAFLKEQGIYKEWQQIFSVYVELATAGNLEAGKRALFYVWYQYAEPGALSGITNLDADLVERILKIMNSYIEDEGLDLELKWMLPFYYSITDLYLKDIPGLNALLNASTKNENLWTTEKSKSSFENRGQLGEYWRAIRGYKMGN